MQLTQTAMAKTGVVQIARMAKQIQSPHRFKYIDDKIKLGTNAVGSPWTWISPLVPESQGTDKPRDRLKVSWAV